MTIYDENNVPVLDRGPNAKIGLSSEKLKHVESKKAAALKADPDDLGKHLLLGEVVLVHNKRPVTALITDENGDPVLDGAGNPTYAAGGPEFTSFSIGSSDLHQAVTEVIGAFDLAHLGEPNQSQDHLYTPDWVASTNKDLAQALADYYSCDVREIAEVL